MSLWANSETRKNELKKQSTNFEQTSLQHKRKHSHWRRHRNRHLALPLDVAETNEANSNEIKSSGVRCDVRSRMGSSAMGTVRRSMQTVKRSYTNTYIAIKHTKVQYHKFQLCKSPRSARNLLFRLHTVYIFNILYTIFF